MDSFMNRQAIVAGQFYPANPGTLVRELEAFFRSAHTAPLPGSLPAPAEDQKESALLTLLPHAGYVYCGNVIGATLSRVRLPKRIVLIGPNHTGIGADLAVWSEGFWEIPTGTIPVDIELASALIASQSGYSADMKAHQREHSLEVLLPFLKYIQPELQITPIAVSCRPESLQDAGIALGKVLAHYGSQCAMILSSDMNHYEDKETTLKQDSFALQAFLSLDPVCLFDTVTSRHISMCGILPATLGLHACLELGASRTELVCHTTSADAFGDTSRTVGYAGAYVI